MVTSHALRRGLEHASYGTRANDLVEDLKGYMVQLPKHAKYAQILKNSVVYKETANERIFLMKDLSAVEEAVGLGAKIVEEDVAF